MDLKKPSTRNASRGRKSTSPIDEYFAQIADDNRAPPALRVKAAIERGTLAGVRMSDNALYAMQIGTAFEAALQLYAGRFPPRQEPPQDYADADD
jgi:hypothetical protein